MEARVQDAQVLRLKASLHPFTLLELDSLDIPAIEDELTKRLQQAPQLLKNAPIVIQLPNQTIAINDAEALLSSLRGLGFIPVGLRCEQDNQVLSSALNLPLINESNGAKNKKTKAPVNKKLVKTAVRSGQQVVNPDGDLVIMGNVGQGAEVLASGSIYIHGTLYGRALAGIKGDTQASISCHKLEAELFSIAGQYQVSDDMNHEHWQKTCYIHMQDGRLILKSV